MALLSSLAYGVERTDYQDSQWMFSTSMQWWHLHPDSSAMDRPKGTGQGRERAASAIIAQKQLSSYNESNRFVWNVLQIDTDATTAHGKHWGQCDEIVFRFWHSERIRRRSRYGWEWIDEWSEWSYPLLLLPPSISMKAASGRVNLCGTLMHK